MTIFELKTGAQMKNLVSISVLLASLALLAGCPSNKKGDTPPPPTPTTADTSGVENAEALAGDTDASMGPTGDLLNKRIIYFDFDRAEVRADSQSVVAAHAAYLSKNPNQKVRLEGHADERGSREYNIGLGERRGQTVRRALALQGVAEAQLSTVSYGEERPAAAGSDEQAYALNRRVEIIYLK
jgi:peptidoglycan-associated lipoprotein